MTNDEGRRLFIGGTNHAEDPGAIKQILRELFCQFGEITDIYVPTNSASQGRGFAFITFSEIMSAQAALAMDGQMEDGRQLVVNLAKPRPVRQKDF